MKCWKFLKKLNSLLEKLKFLQEEIKKWSLATGKDAENNLKFENIDSESLYVFVKKDTKTEDNGLIPLIVKEFGHSFKDNDGP